MDMGKASESQAPQRMLSYSGEDHVAQLLQYRAHQAREAVCHDHHHRSDHRQFSGRRRQTVHCGTVEEWRDDGRQFRQNQQGKCDDDPQAQIRAPARPKIRRDPRNDL